MYTNTSNTSKGRVEIESGRGVTSWVNLLIVIELEIVPTEIFRCSDFWRLPQEGCAVKITEQKREMFGTKWRFVKCLNWNSRSFSTKFQLIELEMVDLGVLLTWCTKVTMRVIGAEIVTLATLFTDHLNTDCLSYFFNNFILSSDFHCTWNHNSFFCWFQKNKAEKTWEGCTLFLGSSKPCNTMYLSSEQTLWIPFLW